MKEVKITGLQFKNLLRLGYVKVLEGNVTGKNEVNDDFHFSRSGTIRPPVGLLEDNAEVTINKILIITDVEAENEDGDLCDVVFDINEVQALIKIL